MFLCGNVDSAAQEPPHVHRTLGSVFRALVSIPEAVLVNEFSSGEKAGVVYYVMQFHEIIDTLPATALIRLAGCLYHGWGLHMGCSPAVSRLLHIAPQGNIFKFTMYLVQPHLI